MRKSPVYVSNRDVSRLLRTSDSIRLARKAYIKLARHQALSPERLVLTVPRKTSFFVMPAHVLGQKTVAVKIARLNPANPARGLPSVMASLQVYDSTTGAELARVDAEELTAIRTAASSAVATDLLAPTLCDTLGIVGTGKQAMAHVPALLKVRRLSEILVYSRSKAHSRRFADQIHKTHPVRAKPIASLEDLVSSSQILVLATNSKTPLFNGNLVNPGTHVNAIGSALPTTREVDTDLVARSFVVVDSIPQALSTYGDIMIPLKQKKIGREDLNELGHLLTHHPTLLPRRGMISLFKSGGLAALDAIFADYIVGRLTRQ
jgi:ornithine cyclodeaminase/alanine dehydrogenase-like protein (mu-crystallin family)